MASKLVHLSLNAYNALKKAKKGSESFSQVILRDYGGKKKNIMDVAGILSEKRAKELEEGVKLVRKNFKLREWLY